MTLSVSMTHDPDCFYLYPKKDIDGSLRVRPHGGRRPLALVSCTTISVYVNLSKSVPPEGSALKTDRPGEAVTPHLRVQRYNFS